MFWKEDPHPCAGYNEYFWKAEKGFRPLAKDGFSEKCIEAPAGAHVQCMTCKNHSPNLQGCSSCKALSTLHCCKRCQEKDWPNHKSICKRLQRSSWVSGSLILSEAVTSVWTTYLSALSTCTHTPHLYYCHVHTHVKNTQTKSRTMNTSS
jgi:hypothetical protein